MACVAYGCTSHSSKVGGNKVAFHRFPYDEEFKEIWVKALRRKNWKPSKYSRICSKHFTSECYVKDKARKVLYRDAVPTIFEDYPGYLQEESSKFVQKQGQKIQRKIGGTRRKLRPPLDSGDSKPAQPSTSISSRSLREPRFDDTSLVKMLKKALLKESKKSTRRRVKLKTCQQRCRRLQCRILKLENTILELQSNMNIDDESTPIYIIVSGENKDFK